MKPRILMILILSVMLALGGITAMLALGAAGPSEVTASERTIGVSPKSLPANENVLGEPDNPAWIEDSNVKHFAPDQISSSGTRVRGALPKDGVNPAIGAEFLASSHAVDLSITKGDSPDPVVAGAELTYSLTVTNGVTGAGVATGVFVTDTFPGEVTLVSASPSQGVTNPVSGGLIWEVGVLTAGQTETLDIVVTVDSGTAGGTILTNTAVVQGDQSDPNPTNDTAIETTFVIGTGGIDLSITKVDSPDPVAPGDDLTYTLKVTNGVTGAAVATGVFVTDTFPSSVTFKSAVPSQGVTNLVPGGLTWDVGALIDGQSETLVIVVTVDAGAIDGTILTNTAVVQGDQSDPDPSNNTSIVTTLVALPAEIDLSITKGDSTDPVSPGANLTYSLTVAYGVSGSAVATGVFVMDTLPEGVTFVSVVPSQGIAISSGENVSWDVGVLSSGQAETLEIVVTVDLGVPDGTVLTNTAVVEGDQADPNLSNNTAIVTTTVAGTAPATCTLSLTPSYGAGTLMIEVVAGANVPTTAKLWRTSDASSASLFNGELAPVDLPISAVVSEPLPPSGTVLVIATMSTPEFGIICFDVKAVDTGSPS